MTQRVRDSQRGVGVRYGGTSKRISLSAEQHAENVADAAAGQKNEIRELCGYKNAKKGEEEEEENAKEMENKIRKGRRKRRDSRRDRADIHYDGA